MLQVQKDTARLQRGPVTVGVLRAVDGQEDKSTMNFHFVAEVLFSPAKKECRMYQRPISMMLR